MNRACKFRTPLVVMLGITLLGAMSLSPTAARDAWSIVAAALFVLAAVSLLSRQGGERRSAARVADTVPPVPLVAAEPPPTDVAGQSSTLRADLLRDAVLAFQDECSRLMLDAEAARVQTESCEGGVRALGEAGRSLAATCDVLGRRAGLTQSHALMSRCATADALEAVTAAMERIGALDAPETGPHAGAASSAGAVHDELARARRALDAALERGDEAARVAASLGGAAARGEQYAQTLSEACSGLAPSLAESARTGLRLSMLSASMEESSGRISRMFESTLSGRPWIPTPVPRPAPVPPAAATRVAQAEGNVVWVRFADRNAAGADVEHG